MPIRILDNLYLNLQDYIYLYALFLVLPVRFSKTSGCFAATINRTFAGPSGLRLPCSQLRSVETLIPIFKSLLTKQFKTYIHHLGVVFGAAV